jgi:rhamnogalacturonyl hydrolase YesR
VLYRAAGIAHKTLKILLGKEIADYSGDFFEIIEEGIYSISKINDRKPAYLNDARILLNSNEVLSKDLFYGENVGTNIKVEHEKEAGNKSKRWSIPEDPASAWLWCLQRSIVGEGFKNSGFCLNGFIWDKDRFCLSSWIWTSAAVARYLVKCGDLKRACIISEAFFREQQECGGWIVRYDFSGSNVYPMLAPNDSAYIANNCMLALYRATHENIYLESARKCASWIMRTMRPDGLVSNGYNMASSAWEDSCVIVDTGFTAGLFASLFEITGEVEYRVFLERFVKKFVKCFFNEADSLFATSINKNGEHQGGYFSRGQAWALEGLIPAYEATAKPDLFELIESCVRVIITKQRRDGSWPYNLAHTFMGEDCKGTPVIALALLRWQEHSSYRAEIQRACTAALRWCEKNTAMAGPAAGMIFSYSFEGAVVHHAYSSTAFVYASAYALELKQKLVE